MSVMKFISKLKTIPLSIRIRITNYYWSIQYKVDPLLNKLLKRQRQNPLSIPIIIINFNQLFFLRQLVDFLLQRNFEQIVILDNNSDYPPLLSYYNEIKDNVIIERMEHNYGHTVFFQHEWLQKKYGQGYYVITDADIVPCKDMPEDFMNTLIGLLDKYHSRVTKVGLALNIEDIPTHYNLKAKVLEWESQFWKKRVEEELFDAPVDTTFAIYKPGYPKKYDNIDFIIGYRLGGKYTARHGGWYLDSDHPSEEYLHYQKSANASHSWREGDSRNV
jgi:hypothetical protein